MPHYSRGQRETGGPVGASLERALAASAPAIGLAWKLADEALRDAGVRRLVAGGLAVAAWGYERATRDVDFLVGDEAFVRRGPLVFPRGDIPVDVGGVLIDLVTLPQHQWWVDQELASNPGPVVSLPFLVWMKLVAWRPRDRVDIVELLRLDADRAPLVLGALGPALSAEHRARLEGCVGEAR